MKSIRIIIEALTPKSHILDSTKELKADSSQRSSQRYSVSKYSDSPRYCIRRISPYDMQNYYYAIGTVDSRRNWTSWQIIKPAEHLATGGAPIRPATVVDVKVTKDNSDLAITTDPILAALEQYNNKLRARIDHS